jgi:transcriptional regulator with XRE-family HTH domain
MGIIGTQFSRNMKAARRAASLSQPQLAAHLNVSMSYISMLERGVRTPSLDLVERMAEVLHIHPNALLTDSEPAPEANNEDQR